MELNCILAILNRDRCAAMEGVFQSLRLPLALTMMCRGTATTEHLSLYGLLPTQKALLTTVADGEQTRRLMRAAKLQKRAARGGVEVQADADAVAEAARKAQTDNEADRQAAVGQMLFAAVALARRLGVDPEQALQYQNAQFTAHPTSCQEAEPPHSC